MNDFLLVLAGTLGGAAAVMVWQGRRRNAPEVEAVPERVVAPAPTADAAATAVVAKPRAGGRTGQPLAEVLAPLLRTADPAHAAMKKRVIALLASGSGVPSISASAMKLTTLTRQEHIGFDELAAVISLDPGIASRCLRAASGVAAGGQPVATLNEALLRLGQREIRRVAVSGGVVEAFSRSAVPVDWHAFWVHSILVARVTEKLASAFQEPTGVEYLAGLLHDSGKLFLQQHFPEQFSQVIARAREDNGGHAPVETELLGLNHAQIGAAICATLNLHPQIIRGILFHHDPRNESHSADPNGDNGFLAGCLAVADALAHRVKPSLGGEADVEVDFDSLPEWQNLARFPRIRSLDLDLRRELGFAEADFQALFAGA